jgi:hypothetical protein
MAVLHTVPTARLVSQKVNCSSQAGPLAINHIGDHQPVSCAQQCVTCCSCQRRAHCEDRILRLVLSMLRYVPCYCIAASPAVLPLHIYIACHVSDDFSNLLQLHI